MTQQEYRRLMVQLALVESFIADVRAVALRERYADEYADLAELEKPAHQDMFVKYAQAWQDIMVYMGHAEQDTLPHEVVKEVRKIMDATTPTSLSEALNLITKLEAYQIPF